MRLALTSQISRRKLLSFSYLQIVILSEDFLCRKLPFHLTGPDLNYLGLSLVTCNFKQIGTFPYHM